MTTVKDILETIQRLSLEARNPRNDSWTQKAYRQHLLTIQENVNEAIACVNELGATVPRVVATVPGEPKQYSTSPAAHAVAAPEIVLLDNDS